ncbi:MAG: DNA repair protein RadC [bacterium]
MCSDLFEMLLQTGGPHQKTVIFCTRDTHADAVATEMNNLYADWCIRNGKKRLSPYAFKCTAAASGSQYISDLRGSERSHFVATTVDLITTGVDVPILRNVVFFKYVRSPIAFQQMMGRGSRIHLPTNKLMFRVYDYTNATRLLGKGFVSRPSPTGGNGPGIKEPIIRVEGFEVHINPAGTYILIKKEGKMTKAAQIKSALELGKRLFKEDAEKRKKIKKAEDVLGYVAEYYGPYLRDAQKEFFYAIILDIKNKPIHNVEISKGSLSATVVDPKEIVKEATLNSGSSIILVHNHPSGEAEPSSEDMEITNRIIQACQLVGIKVLDHIIIGKNEEDYYSFAKEGLIK